MNKPQRILLTVAAALLMHAVGASAQFPSPIVSFEGTPSGDPSNREMFWEPQWSGSTVGYVVANTPGSFDRNAAFRNPNVNFATDGSQALEVLWKWVDQNDPNAWVRLATFNAPGEPNPSLDTRGKVRFDLTNFGDFTGGALGVCIGIRETGVDVPQLDDGGTSGPIEWVGVDPSINAIIAGSNGVADSTAAGDDVQVVPMGTSGLDPQAVVILPGPNGDIDTTPAGDDVARFGYFIGSNGTRTPVPAVVLAISFLPYSLEFDLTTGDVTVDDGFGPVTTPAAIVSFTGNGVLDPANDRGALEHIAFTNVTTDPPTSSDPGIPDASFGIDKLQFEATVPDPVLPPTVVAPIIQGDTEVTVTDLMASVNRVTLLVDGSPAAAPIDVVNNDDVVFTIAEAQAGQVYTATQRDGITGITSAESAPVTVLPEPSPYSFSLLIDETGGGSCVASGWEFVGASSKAASFAPIGQPLFPNDAIWQTVDVPLDDPALVQNGLGGNGVLDPSPTGFWTTDSLWFTIAPGATSNGLGPWEVFIDAVQLINSNSVVGETILDMEDGVNRLKNNRGQSSTLVTSSALSTTTSYDGTTSHRLLWTYPSTAPTQSMGILQRVEFACGTSELIKDTSLAVRFHMLMRKPRSNPATPLPQVVGPIVVGDQTSVRVVKDAAGVNVQLYINGVAEGPPVSPVGTEVDFTGLTLNVGDSISATQEVGTSGVSDFAYPRAVVDRPPPPSVAGPIFPGALQVTVENLLQVQFATADFVSVYKGGNFVGSAATGGAASAPVDIILGGPLQQGDVITATQWVNNAESAQSAPVIVGVPGPTLHHAPAQGDTVVKVVDVNTNATLVTVFVGTNGTSFSAAPGLGATSVDVPVSGLVQGMQITARQTVSGNPSGLSAPETVTTNVATDIICDNFEYANQAAFETVWPARSGTVAPTLSTDTNTTPGGAKSLFSSGNVGSIYIFAPNNINPIRPTAEQPVVLNVNIFDPSGVGGTERQWVDLDGHFVVSGGDDFFLIEVGMTGSGGFAPNGATWYALRVIGNGGPNWVDLSDFDAPMRSVGWHNLTVVHKGSFVDAYVDGLLAKKNIPLSEPTDLAVARLGPNPFSGAGENAYFDDYCAQVGPVTFPTLSAQPPTPPVVQSPIEDGDTSVTLDVGGDDVTGVIIHANAGQIAAQSYPAGTNGLVTLTVPALVHLQSITATSSNSNGTSPLSAALEVGDGNGDLLVCIGVRDANNQIEWIGASTATNGAPQGKPVTPGATWVTLTFDPATDGKLGFTGDGVIDGVTGTLEHLAVAVNAASPQRSSGAYAMYVDNVVNVGAGAGGSDVVIADFEGFTLGAEVLFQEPTFSGSTSSHLSFPPSGSSATNIFANGGTQSELLTWFFKDTTAQRWARITTSGTPNLPSPTIDLTKPIRLDILLPLGCQSVLGDFNGDCKIDLADYAELAGCLVGPAVAADPGCPCGDLDGSGRIDLVDFKVFQEVFTGTALVPGCTP